MFVPAAFFLSKTENRNTSLPAGTFMVTIDCVPVCGRLTIVDGCFAAAPPALTSICMLCALGEMKCGERPCEIARDGAFHSSVMLARVAPADSRSSGETACGAAGSGLPACEHDASATAHTKLEIP
jgi:hypothetical protein